MEQQQKRKGRQYDCYNKGGGIPRCWAEVGNNDINAVDSTGVEFEAGQICTEDDNAMRQLLSLNEYQPVLEVSELTWHGTFLRYPNLTIMVTDGLSHMLLRPSFRRSAFSKGFFAKKGPLYTGRLDIGMEIKLLDYTTSLWVDKHGAPHPCIFAEKLRAEPKRNKNHKQTIRV